jgi:hypothetical protein
MLINKQETIVTFTRESSSFKEFTNNFFTAYPKYTEYHLIINLFSIDKLTTDEILEFLDISEKHRSDKKSFVLVADTVNIEDIPESIMVVPTLQEALDIIEMEEIERDLDF